VLLEKFEIILCLFAGLVVLIVGILVNAEFSAVLIRLLITLFGFYVLGLAVRIYMQKRVFFKEELPETEGFEGEEGGEEQEENSEELEADENASE